MCFSSIAPSQFLEGCVAVLQRALPWKPWTAPSPGRDLQMRVVQKQLCLEALGPKWIRHAPLSCSKGKPTYKDGGLACPWTRRKPDLGL